MPEMFDGRATPRENAPKPPRLGGAQGATNAEPSTAGVAAGGTDNINANGEVYDAADSRAKVSSLRATRAAVASFNPASV